MEAKTGSYDQDVDTLAGVFGDAMTLGSGDDGSVFQFGKPAKPASKPTACDFCGSIGNDLKLCSRCKIVACQLTHSPTDRSHPLADHGPPADRSPIHALTRTHATHAQIATGLARRQAGRQATKSSVAKRRPRSTRTASSGFTTPMANPAFSSRLQLSLQLAARRWATCLW